MHKIVRMFGIDIDALTRIETLHVIKGWLSSDERNCRYVVTPNVDHVVMLFHSEEFRRAYHKASLTVADGKPVVGVSRLLGHHLPETVTGSDLVPALFSGIDSDFGRDVRVFLLGAGPGVGRRASGVIESKWKSIRVAGVYSPPFGFEKDVDECARICQMVNSSGAELLILGLGAPKQELWVSDHQADLSVKVALCVGATIDFIAGEKSRAPDWIQILALEWAYRIFQEPRRLARRYAKDAFWFPLIVLRELFRGR